MILKLINLFPVLTALGICCFTQDQIDYGCGIVDIGYEKTSIALFKDSSLVRASSFPIGSNHITKGYFSRLLFI